MPFVNIFGPEFGNIIVIFEISTLEFAKNRVLTHMIIFGIVSSKSKGPRSALCQGPGLRKGLLYEVCLSLLFNSQMTYNVIRVTYSRAKAMKTAL